MKFFIVTYRHGDTLKTRRLAGRSAAHVAGRFKAGLPQALRARVRIVGVRPDAGT